MAPSNHENTARVLPDVASEERAALAGALDWVGMGEIEMPVVLAGDGGRSVAKVNAFVNLTQPDVRGIHMSRLYLHVDKMLSNEPASPASLRRLLALPLTEVQVGRLAERLIRWPDAGAVSALRSAVEAQPALAKARISSALWVAALASGSRADAAAWRARAGLIEHQALPPVERVD